MKNLYDTRIFLEASLVRHAALQARKEDLEALRAALAANEAAIPDSEQFYRTDTAFHAVLYDIPKNPVFPAIHKAFTAWLAPHWLRRSSQSDLPNSVVAGQQKRWALIMPTPFEWCFLNGCCDGPIVAA